MSLDFSLTQVSEETKALWNDESRTEEERNESWAAAQAVILWTMSCGIGEVTKSNWREFYMRWALLHEAYGGGEKFLSEEHFERMIGLKVNVLFVPTKTWLRDYLASAMKSTLSRQNKEDLTKV